MSDMQSEAADIIVVVLQEIATGKFIDGNGREITYGRKSMIEMARAACDANGIKYGILRSLGAGKNSNSGQVTRAALQRSDDDDNRLSKEFAERERAAFDR
jgi:hypothetical protein